jgi:hypothetical protein
LISKIDLGSDEVIAVLPLAKIPELVVVDFLERWGSAAQMFISNKPLKRLTLDPMK